MDTFNIIAGLVTILSLFFSLWIYMDGKRKEGVEMERKASLISKLNDLYQTAEAIERQAHLIANVSDRDETAKKELKHLTIALAYTTNIIQRNITEEIKSKDKWVFGIPSKYVFMDSDKIEDNEGDASEDLNSLEVKATED